MPSTNPATRSHRFLRRLLLPSLLDVFFAAFLVAAFAYPQGAAALLADGDTGWHIRAGELVLKTGHVPTADPFSFSRPGQPWFAWEWLADVCFALLWRFRGVAAVANLAGALLAGAATVLLAWLLRRGYGLWVSLIVTLAAVSASSVHYLARPHVFSILFYTVTLWLLAEDRAQATRLVWLVVPLTAIWTNLHGGFVAWIATLGVLLVLCTAQRNWKALRRYGFLASLCCAASLLNPYGWRLHLHIGQYLSSSWILDNVQEFQSPVIRSEGMIVFAVLLLAAGAVAPRSERFEGILVFVWGFASLRSARNIPFFAIAAGPVVASGLATAWQRLALQSDGRSATRIFWDLARDLGRHPRISLWLPISAVLVITMAPATGFPASVFPVKAVETNLRELAPPSLMPRVLTSDQWADYLIFRLYPRERVFFDGRSDFFGPAIGSDYHALLVAGNSWPELLDRYSFDLALLPRDWPLSNMLAHQPGWRRIYQDRLAVLYARQSGAPGETEAVAGGS